MRNCIAEKLVIVVLVLAAAVPAFANNDALLGESFATALTMAKDFNAKMRAEKASFPPAVPLPLIETPLILPTGNFSSEVYEAVSGWQGERLYEDGINLGAVSFAFAYHSYATLQTSTTKASLRFMGLSDDGKRITVRIKYSHPAFARTLASQRQSFNAEVELEPLTCDNKPFVEKRSDQEGLEDVVARFSRLQMKVYLRCEFKFSEAVVDDNLVVGLYWGHLGNRDLTITQEEDIIVRSSRERGSNEAQIVFRRPAGAPLEASDGTAVKSAEKFVGLLKEYGNLIILQSQASPVQRQTAVKAFLAKNGLVMAASLRGVGEGFGGLTLLQKIWVVKTVNQAYADVRYFERQIAQEFNLDLTLRSYDN